MAIIPIKTLAKVMIDLFKGDWSKIGDDIKEGFTEMKDTAIDSINVVKQFKEGYDKKTAEQNEAARKAEAEARAKDRDNYIKDMEAKNNSNWKFTAEGKKAYEEYYNALLEMYDKDSEEYRQALRDKEAYLRDFNENAQKEAEDLAATELKLDVVRYGESVKYSEKWYNYEKKLYQDAMKLGEKYRPPYANIEPMPPEVEQKITEAQLRWETYLKSRNDYYKKQNADFQKETDKLVSDFKSKFDALVDDRWKAIRNAQEIKEALNKTLKIGNEDYEALELYLEKWEKMFKEIGTYSDTEIKTFTAEIKREIQNGAITSAWEAYISALSKPLEKTFYDMDKSVQTFVNDLQLSFDEKKLLFGIQFPEDEFDRVTEIFNAKIDNANLKAAEVRERIDLIYETLAEQFSASTEQELAAVLPGFKKLLEEEQNFCDEVTRLNNEREQKVSDIDKQDWENRINIVKEGNQAVNDIADQNFKEQINNAMRWQGVYGNALRDVYEDIAYDTETYEEKKGQLERLLQMYQDMANDERLTFEEKENAKREAAKVTGELMQLEYNNEVNRLKNQKALIKEWANAFKDAFSGLGDILSNISDYYTGLMELEQAKIDKQLEDKEITEEQAKELYAQQRDNFEKSKNMQLAMTWINGFSAAIGAYQSMASIPYVGPVLGAVAAAAALASGYAQVRQIQATNYESSSTGGGSPSSSTNFQLPNVMELEPELRQNLTGMDDIDNLNNDGSGRGRGGDNVVKAYVVESDINAAQKVSSKRNQEVTF
jgi:hypothetical protein